MVRKLTLALTLLGLISFSSLSAQNECSACKEAFSNLYQYHSVNSDRSYLNKVYTYYNTTYERNQSSDRNSSGFIAMSGGLGEFNDNKKKVDKIYKKYEGVTDFTLSIDEKLELTSVYTREGDVKIAYEKWIECIKLICGKKSFLEIVDVTDSIVIVGLKMHPPSESTPSNSKVKVRQIVYNPQILELFESNIPKNNKIEWRGSYTIKFKRLLNSATIVGIDLEKEKILPVSVSPIGPICDTDIVSGKIDYRIEANISKNWLYVYNPDGSLQLPTTWFKNQGGKDYYIEFNVLTSSLPKDAKITDSYFTKSSGKPYNFHFSKFVNDNTNNQSYTENSIKSKHRPFTGTYTIYYTYKEIRCRE
jgi:hypothetical protein